MKIENIFPNGDRALTISFGKEIKEEIHYKVRFLYNLLKVNKREHIIDIIPTYTSVTLYYDWRHINYYEVKSYVEQFLEVNTFEKFKIDEKIIKVPVCYDGSFAYDIERVAEKNHLTVKEVIKRHTSQKYLIYMMGFLPGFPYLGGLDESIATPRLSRPRLAIETGSVGIAGCQTGIYSSSSPGGWNIIGRTPLKLYDPEKSSPFLFSMGNQVEFFEITKEEFNQYKMTEEKVK